MPVLLHRFVYDSSLSRFVQVSGSMLYNHVVSEKCLDRPTSSAGFSLLSNAFLLKRSIAFMSHMSLSRLHGFLSNLPQHDPTMPGRGHSLTEQQWEAYKPVIERLYLDQDLSLNETLRILENDYNLVPLPTGRQMKVRFARWGWTTKIEEERYMAMFMILEQRGDMVFFIPRRGGRKWKTKRPADIRKEVQRKQKKRRKTRQQQPQTPWDISAAVHVLHDEHARVGSSLKNSRPILEAIAIPQNLGTEDIDEDSTISASSLTDTPYSNSGLQELNDRNYAQQVPQLRLLHHEPDFSARPRQYDRLPFEGAFGASLLTTLMPQASVQDLLEGLRRDPVSEAVRISSSEASPADDGLFTDLTRQLEDCFLNEDDLARRLMDQERQHRMELERHYRETDPDDSKAWAVGFASYYTQQCMAGFETLDPIEHPDRQESRGSLKRMLERNNNKLLPTILFLSTVLGAHDKSDQLSEFYDDCWDCIEETDSWTAEVIRPVIVQMVLQMHDNQGENQRHYQLTSDRAERLQLLKASFDHDRAFSQSIKDLAWYDPGDTPTSLVLKSYHAWYLLKTGTAEGARGSFSILIENISKVEKVMGLQHLVTVNYHYLFAQTYEKLGDFGLAENSFRMALCRLQGCAKSLYAYYYHLYARLAALQWSQDHVEAAIWNYEEVFRFRLSTLGTLNQRTWGAAQSLFDILRSQGRSDEAQTRESEFLAQRDQEYKVVNQWV